MTEKQTNLPSMFKLFGGTEEERKEKIMILAKHLKDGYLVLPDECRNYEYIYGKVIPYYNLPAHLFYEIGEYSGLVGFTNIVMKQRADVLFKLWDKEVFGKTFVRQLDELLNTVVKELNLMWLNSITADERVVKLAKMVGFKVDGEREDDFTFDGENFKTYFLNRLGE